MPDAVARSVEPRFFSAEAAQESVKGTEKRFGVEEGWFFVVAKWRTGVGGLDESGITDFPWIP